MLAFFHIKLENVGDLFIFFNLDEQLADLKNIVTKFKTGVDNNSNVAQHAEQVKL